MSNCRFRFLVTNINSAILFCKPLNTDMHFILLLLQQYFHSLKLRILLNLFSAAPRTSNTVALRCGSLCCSSDKCTSTNTVHPSKERQTVSWPRENTHTQDRGSNNASCPSLTRTRGLFRWLSGLTCGRDSSIALSSCQDSRDLGPDIPVSYA